MVVKTINPVIIDKKRISRPSTYLSFDASKSSEAQIKQFQIWHNKKGYTPKLIEDGVVTKGKNTEKAIAKYGDEFDKIIGAMAGILTGVASGSSNTPSSAEQIEQAKQGKVWDNAKGWWIQSGRAQEVLSKLKGSGILGNPFGGLFGGGNQPQNQGGGVVAQPPLPEEKKGLSSGAKIGIAVGGALVLGLLIYAVTRKK